MKMKEVKFDKKEDENSLVIQVELPRRELGRDPVIEFSNSDMIEYLKNAGIKVENYELESQTKTSLTSYADKRNKPILTGTWTFTKKQKPVEKKVNKKPNRSYNKSKENNTGD